MKLDIGIHPDIPEAVYHSDPAVEISASASVLRTLYDRSPEHAWAQHPRLNSEFKPSTPTDAQNRGTILHWFMAERGKQPFRPLSFDDYRTAKAREVRDACIEAGVIPILEKNLDELLPVADRLRARIKAEYPDLHAALHHPDTQREVTVIWRENGIMCRQRSDLLPPPQFDFMCDFKFTGLSADPDDWSKRLRDTYLYQPDFYPRGVKACRGDSPEFRFIVCEWDPPYGVSIHAMSPELAEVAKRRVNVGLRQWAHCMRENHWPGYPPLVHYAEAPGWFLMEEEGRVLRDTYAAKAMPSHIAAVHRISAEIGSPIR